MIKNDNFTLLLTSSGQEWQFHIAIDLADKHTLADGPPLIDHKCLDYHYTNMADKPTLANGPLK